MKSVWKTIRIILAIVLIVYGVVQLGTTFSNMRLERETNKSQEQSAIDVLKSGFDELRIGMTYEECVAILGSEGELFSETESEYFGKSAIYLWKPEDTLFTGIEAHFDNGELSSKTWVE